VWGGKCSSSYVIPALADPRRPLVPVQAQLEMAALQFEIETLKKQIDDNGKTVQMDEDYR
jgi:hypothetical protein